MKKTDGSNNTELIDDMRRDVLNLMAETEKLKSTIRIISQTKEELDL